MLDAGGSGNPGEGIMPKHLVFVGGGHAHLTALLRLRDYVRLKDAIDRRFMRKFQVSGECCESPGGE